MRFLIDEMFHPEVARQLCSAGHDGVHVGDVGLAGAEDVDIAARAAADDWVVVTENAVDFVSLLDARTAAGQHVPPVVIALKRTLPAGAGAISHHLAARLVRWAERHASPYRHVHWLGRG